MIRAAGTLASGLNLAVSKAPGITYLALRHTLLQSRVLRSGDPAGIEQEMWALLALYPAVQG